MAIQPRGSTSFVTLTCRCGKTLRAKLDQVGTEIRCWSCRQMVMVPMPRERLRVAREFTDGFMAATEGPALVRIVAVAAGVTAGLCIPTAGLAVGVAVLALAAAVGYGPEIAEAAQIEEAPGAGRAAARLSLPGRALRWALGAALATGLALPLWAWHVGDGHPPRLDRPGLLILAATLVILPLANMAANGNGHRGAIGVRRLSRSLLRYPGAYLLALAIVPACLVLMEVGMVALFYVQGNLPFFILEFMPWKEQPIVYLGVPYFHSVDFRSYPVSKFAPLYSSGLARGYSFVASFPPSLSLDSRAGLGGAAMYIPESAYGPIRAFITLVMLTVLTAACSIQARWLGAIATFDRRRPGPVRRKAEAPADQAQLPGPTGPERNQ